MVPQLRRSGRQRAIWRAVAGVRYGPAGGGELLLRLGVDDDVFVVQLLDNGRPVADADLRPRPLDEIRPGGLGVRFMRELMDDLAYIQAPAGFVNCLQLRKRIS